MPKSRLSRGRPRVLVREFVRHIDQGECGKVDEIWVIARRAERLEALVRTTRTPRAPVLPGPH